MSISFGVQRHSSFFSRYYPVAVNLLRTLLLLEFINSEKCSNLQIVLVKTGCAEGSRADSDLTGPTFASLCELQGVTCPNAPLHKLWTAPRPPDNHETSVLKFDHLRRQVTYREDRGQNHAITRPSPDFHQIHAIS